MSSGVRCRVYSAGVMLLQHWAGVWSNVAEHPWPLVVCAIGEFLPKQSYDGQIRQSLA